jgi:hypothetical protein
MMATFVFVMLFSSLYDAFPTALAICPDGRGVWIPCFHLVHTPARTAYTFSPAGINTKIFLCEIPVRLFAGGKETPPCSGSCVIHPSSEKRQNNLASPPIYKNACSFYNQDEVPS